MPDIETLHGVAETRQDTSTYVQNSQFGASYVTSSFRIAGRVVRFQSGAYGHGPEIHPGDEVVVAGSTKSNGVFEALAYRSLNTGVTGTAQSSAGQAVAGVFVMVLGLAIGYGMFWLFETQVGFGWGSQRVPTAGSWISLLIFGGGLGVLGLWLIGRANRISAALDAVRKWQP